MPGSTPPSPTSVVDVVGRCPLTCAGVARQQYLPDDLQGKTDYYQPTDRGFEARLQERWTWLKERLGRS